MKKCIVLLVPVLLLLMGCEAQQTLETVNDVLAQPVSAQVQQVLLDMPQEAAAPAMEDDVTGKLWLCDGYTLTMQTVEAGDLEKTLRSVTGFPKSELAVVETAQGDVKRYECVWTAAGETEPQVCRACVLDDGSYHYILTAMAGESQAGQLRETFQTLFNSFRLAAPDTGA